MAVSNPNAKIFEADAWEQLATMDAEMDGDFLPGLFDTFLDSTPAKLAELKAAIAGGDMNATGKIAHYLKSSTSSLAMMPLSSLFAELEAAARSGSADGTPALFSKIEKGYNDARAAVEKTRGSLKAA